MADQETRTTTRRRTISTTAQASTSKRLAMPRRRSVQSARSQLSASSLSSGGRASHSSALDDDGVDAAGDDVDADAVFGARASGRSSVASNRSEWSALAETPASVRRARRHLFQSAAGGQQGAAGDASDAAVQQPVAPLFDPAHEPIKVSLRLRPVLSAADAHVEPTVLALSDQVVALRPPRHNATTNALARARLLQVETRYAFTRVLDAQTTQDEVFAQCAAPLVDALFEGHNGLLFAYGITNSGKTFTISGTDDKPGVLPRALDIIFARIAERNAAHAAAAAGTAAVEDKYSVTVSFMEIYNEQLYDLLVPVPEDGQRKPLKLRSHNGQAFPQGLSSLSVGSAAAAQAAMDTGIRNRAVADNHIHADSSRSHSAFTIRVQRSSEHERQTACLHIVDLAGAERSSKTGNQGMRLRETCNINTSLMVLGRVMETLRWNQEHPFQAARMVPFRDSKLTRIFYDILQAGRAHMIATVNTHPGFFEETYHSLRFACLARQVATLAVPTAVEAIGAAAPTNAGRVTGAMTPRPPRPATAAAGGITAADLRQTATAAAAAAQELEEQLIDAQRRLVEVEEEIRREVSEEMATQLSQMRAEHEEEIRRVQRQVAERYDRKLAALAAEAAAQSKTKKTKQLLEELSTRVVEFDHERTSLASQFEQSRASLEAQVSSVITDVRTTREQNERLSAQLQDAERELERRVIALRDEHSASMERARSEFQRALEYAAAHAAEQMARATTEHETRAAAVANEHAAALHDREQVHARELAHVQQKHRERVAQLKQQNSARVQELEAELKRAIDELANKSQRLSTLKKKVSSLELEKEALERRIGDADAADRAARADAERASKHVNVLSSKAADALERLADAERRAAHARAEADALHTAAHEATTALEQRVASLEASLAAANAAGEAHERELVETWAAQAAALNIALNERDQEIERLRAERADLQQLAQQWQQRVAAGASSNGASSSNAPTPGTKRRSLLSLFTSSGRNSLSAAATASTSASVAASAAAGGAAAAAAAAAATTTAAAVPASSVTLPDDLMSRAHSDRVAIVDVLSPKGVDGQRSVRVFEGQLRRSVTGTGFSVQLEDVAAAAAPSKPAGVPLVASATAPAALTPARRAALVSEQPVTECAVEPARAEPMECEHEGNASRPSDAAAFMAAASSSQSTLDDAAVVPSALARSNIDSNAVVDAAERERRRRAGAARAKGVTSRSRTSKVGFAEGGASAPAAGDENAQPLLRGSSAAAPSMLSPTNAEDASDAADVANGRTPVARRTRSRNKSVISGVESALGSLRFRLFS